MHVDQLINEWGLLKYRERFEIYRDSTHLVVCDTAEAKAISAGWECGCYSSVTREDSFQITFEISCNCGYSYEYTPYEGEWSMPTVIRELAEYQENNCYYESDEYNRWYD